MKTSTAWIVYSLLRLVFFAAPFAVLYMMGWPWYFAAIVATLVAISLSVLLLSKPRERAAQSIQEWRDQERTADDIVEDDAIDSVEGSEKVDGSEKTV